MSEIVFRRADGWMPKVVEADGALRLKVVGGADANHDPRVFTIPLEESHAAVIRDDLLRHLLLWGMLQPLCDAAGVRGPLDEDAAVALLDPILFGAPEELDARCRHQRSVESLLIAHGADIALLQRGEVVAASRTITEASDQQRVQEYDANRRRAERGVHLGPLDTALLKYTGQYLHGATIPRRLPDAVDPALLPEVMQVLAAAERAGSGMRIARDPRRGKRATDKDDWKRMEQAVGDAVRRAFPALVDDAVRTVAFLMCSEAAHRSRDAPEEAEDAEHDLRRPLVFTDDKDAELKWAPGGPRPAAAAFWEFVGDRSGSGNQVFTIEDEHAGEGIQLQFHADTAARITTATPAADGSDPVYRVEYGLIDGLRGYRDLVRAFVGGGCAALDRFGPWTTDVDEFERARRDRERA
ncbi:hypothetical protein GCM10009830_00810 [Glycomyces endophyticus]|uniref:CchlT n=1 Tax=Glycomyces endophyticus TaxID=480996 RepID=A0ABP4RSJ0_9ACTN